MKNTAVLYENNKELAAVPIGTLVTITKDRGGLKVLTNNGKYYFCDMVAFTYR